MRIGAHESIAGGVSHAFGRAEAHGAQALQIFTKTARGWNAPPLTEDERRRFRSQARRTGLAAIAHGSYLANLGSEDPLLWERSIDCLTDELSRCEELGVGQLIFHPGCHPDEKRGLRRIAAGIDQIHARCRGFRARLCLEGTAGQGTSLGWRFEHLAELLQLARHGERLGFCLDSCHLFAAGHDLRTRRGYEKVIASFDALVGIDRIRCFHLNDCKKGLGCRVDRHEEIGKGQIGLTAFRCLVNDERFIDHPAVLETPFAERYGDAIALLQSLRRQ